MWWNNGVAERCVCRGGYWNDGAGAGVFCLSGGNSRGGAHTDIGFRPLISRKSGNLAI